MSASEPLPVVIVSYNTRELLRQCLAALRASVGGVPAPIVVDNASHDGSAQMVRVEFPEARLLAQTQNLGFAAANNLALRALGFAATNASAPPFVLLLNPDTEVRPDALATLRDFMCRFPRVGLLGAQLFYPDGRHQASAFRFPGLAQTFFDFFPVHHRLLHSRLNGRYARHRAPFVIDHPLGACMLVRREAIQQAGLLDEDYFMYVEEVDWCRRIKQAGWQIWCEPRAAVVHHEGQATRQFRQKMYVALWRSRLRYFDKHHSRAYAAAVRAIVRLGLWNEQRKLAAYGAEERTQRMAALADVRALL